MTTRNVKWLPLCQASVSQKTARLSTVWALKGHLQTMRIKTFKFDQLHVVNHSRRSGWCVGITLWLISRLQNGNGPLAAISANDALQRICRDTGMLLNSVGKNTITPGYGQLRLDISVLQENYCNLIDSGIPGTWLTGEALPPAGIAVMQLCYQERGLPGLKHRRGNHAGLCVWNPGEALLFDPNMGALYLDFAPEQNNILLTRKIIDRALTKMASELAPNSKYESRFVGMYVEIGNTLGRQRT
ncbi:hypothetical protein [Cupriavidus pauculus]|uniref:hypothetical protein n=1 Tax=Cupriavidus pauculus TaxID=82633 RepID=UPI0020425685|nr:hypothetical protein [Cupriavidus pauculus]MCM3607566.1 hypothetical protein [Cupriavidus pauculus]